jgi:hypothetical protein
MKKALLCVLAAGWVLWAAGCGESGSSASQEEFQKLYKQYSKNFHEKMVGSAENLQPVQITAEAARIWDETFAGHKEVLAQRVREMLKELDAAPALQEDVYLEVASGSRVEPAADQPKGIILKQFLWSPIGAAQMGLNNWLAKLLQPKSFGVRSVLTANAGLLWEADDRNVDKPKLVLRQGPMVFKVELSRVDDYYQVEKVQWLRPKSMGPVNLKPPEGTPAEPGTEATPPADQPADKAAEKPADKAAEKPAAKPAEKPAEKPKG